MHPVVGVAYALTPKTTLRSGFGMFYSSNYFWEGQGARGTWPYALADTLEGLNQAGSTQRQSSRSTCIRTTTTPVPGTPADAQHTMARYNRTPYSVQWNAGVQRELANNLMLEVEYVGNGGRHMPLVYQRERSSARAGHRGPARALPALPVRRPGDGHLSDFAWIRSGQRNGQRGGLCL